MKDPGSHGVFPYLVSPVARDGNIMDDVLADLVTHLLETGGHGLTPLGSTGEFAYLIGHPLPPQLPLSPAAREDIQGAPASVGAL